jgi:hypothetical protein
MTLQERLIMERLKEPFAAESIQWRPGATKGNQALALAYVDARAVQDRLDDILGIGGWQTRITCLPDGCVACELSLLISGQWVVRSDVGGPSEQPDIGDKRKAAASDAIKRAAVRFGIGRYLYELEGLWVDYDPQRKRLVGKPKLPVWALPKQIPDADLLKRALAILEPESKKGWVALEKAWEVLSPQMKRAAVAEMPRLKKEASDADAAAA